MTMIGLDGAERTRPAATDWRRGLFLPVTVAAMLIVLAGCELVQASLPSFAAADPPPAAAPDTVTPADTPAGTSSGPIALAPEMTGMAKPAVELAMAAAPAAAITPVAASAPVSSSCPQGRLAVWAGPDAAGAPVLVCRRPGR